MILETFVIFLEHELSREQNLKNIISKFNARLFPAVSHKLINITPPFITWGYNTFRHDPSKRQLKLSYGEAGCCASHIHLYNYLLHSKFFQYFY